MLNENVVWCLHCERVGVVHVDSDGDNECAYCGAGELDLSPWSAEYAEGQTVNMYSAEFMAAMGWTTN
jgi:hypothetical protein